MLLNYKRTMPIKNNHINVNVKNVIKLDHNKKKTRRRRKNKNNKNIPIPLARPNNSVYNPNAITYQTGVGGGGGVGGSIQYPTSNKPTYDMKPRIGFGIDPNSDTTSTNMTQQLLLEHQKKNDDKTKKMLLDYNKYIQESVSAYHTNYYEPLLREHNNLQTDFNKNKINNYAILQQSPLKETYINDFNIDDNLDPWADTDDDEKYSDNTNPILASNNADKFSPRPFENVTDPEKQNLKDPAIPHNTNPILASDNANNPINLPGKQNLKDPAIPHNTNPILASDNADNFLPRPFENNTDPDNANKFLPQPIDEFVTNTLNNTNLKKHFENELVDQQQPNDDSVLEEVMVPQYLSKVNNKDHLKYINESYGLNINSKNLSVALFKDKIKEKLKKSNPSIKQSKIIVNLPATKLTDNQIAEGKKITKK